MIRNEFTYSIIVLAFVFAAGGCSTGEVPAARDYDDNELERDDAGSSDIESLDGGESDVVEGPPPTQAFTQCAAGGRATNGRVTAIQCFGPAEVTEREIGDGEVRWRPGTFRVVVPTH